MFHGLREHVVDFFESCGFACPERKGIPDFLQEVTSKNDQKVCDFVQEDCGHLHHIIPAFRISSLLFQFQFRLLAHVNHTVCLFALVYQCKHSLCMGW